jgi:hypothetical protein
MFAFRARAPIFDGITFRVCAKAEPDGSTTLWIVTDDGPLAVEATAFFTRFPRCIRVKPASEITKVTNTEIE